MKSGVVDALFRATLFRAPRRAHSAPILTGRCTKESTIRAKTRQYRELKRKFYAQVIQLTYATSLVSTASPSGPYGEVKWGEARIDETDSASQKYLRFWFQRG